jgi:ABC-type bacteriocin/lantibiotic exporter with double-glycine peptidase domain
MTRRVLLIDIGVALVAAVVVVIVSPGVAAVGLIALIVLIACGISYALDSVRRRRRSRKRRNARVQSSGR